jgi:hypothetical protein
MIELATAAVPPDDSDCGPLSFGGMAARATTEELSLRFSIRQLGSNVLFRPDRLKESVYLIGLIGDGQRTQTTELVAETEHRGVGT